MSKFSRWSHNKTNRSFTFFYRSLTGCMFDHREKISKGFTRACLSNSNTISTGENHWNRLSLNREGLSIIVLFNGTEDTLAEPALIPVENWVKNIFASNFDISCLFPELNNIFGIDIFHLLSLSVQIKLYLFIVHFTMINETKFFSFCHFTLFGKKIKFWFIFFLKV